VLHSKRAAKREPSTLCFSERMSVERSVYERCAMIAREVEDVKQGLGLVSPAMLLEQTIDVKHSRATTSALAVTSAGRCTNTERAR
jgi:hypothetical protein